MGPLVLKAAPVVALLTSLAGIGFVFLGLNQIAWSYAQPIVGLMPLYLSIAAYFGNVGFGPVPTSLVIATVGIILGWAGGVATPEALSASVENVQAWGISTGFDALGDWSTVGEYIGITFPVALAAAAQTLMNVISASKAGDDYGVPETMVSDGVGTIIGACFGTPFGTAVYIGHPAYKRMGAGIVYSLFNCSVFFIFGVFGLFALVDGFVPKQAVAPLIFFVGIMICQEALEAAPVRQYPAVIFGLFPAVLDWALLGGLNVDNIGNYGYWGFVSLSKADILLSLVSTSIACFLIDRNYLPAAGWCGGAAFLSALGFLHQDKVSPETFSENSALYCLAPPLDTNGTCAEGFTACTNFVAFDNGMGCAPDSTQQWAFMTGYLMVGAMAMLMFGGQRLGWVADTIVDESGPELQAKQEDAKVDLEQSSF
jgi:AGZA family xanthine/uracil permease-like MFS transporter